MATATTTAVSAPQGAVPAGVQAAVMACTKTRSSACAHSSMAPADGTVLPRLVHTLAAQIATSEVRPTPAMLKAAVARIVSGTAWSGYRSGRQRLASLGAVYLNWFLPTSDHCFVQVPSEVRPVLRFDAPDGTWFVDELVTSGYEDGLAARVQELMALGDDNFVGVRLVTLSDPTAAVLVAPDGRHHRLSEVALGV